MRPPNNARATLQVAHRKSSKTITLEELAGTDASMLRNLRNEYLIDRKVQKHDTFTGITGVSEQDAAIQDSQGPIQDRTREHLGPTDVGIVEFRKMVMGAARALQGMGGALMVPVGRLVVLRRIPKQDMVAAMAWITIPALSGSHLGRR